MSDRISVRLDKESAFAWKKKLRLPARMSPIWCRRVGSLPGTAPQSTNCLELAKRLGLIGSQRNCPLI